MAMTRSNFWAAMALTASAMKGFQLRMPTKTGSAALAKAGRPEAKSPTGERREADQRIAVADFFDDLRRERAASGDVAEKFGRLIGILGAAVGQQQHCRLWPRQ
jgi:hypothetical protein